MLATRSAAPGPLRTARSHGQRASTLATASRRRIVRLSATVLLGVGAATAALATDGAAAKAGADWQLAGRLGQAQFIVVPEAKAKDKAYYDSLIAELCPSTATCWLRFFTNSTKAPVALPLPDAIAQEPTVMFQQSAKYGGRSMFQWSCRLEIAGGECF